MNRNLSNIEINILGRHYVVACEPEEEQNLHEAASHLNRIIAGMKHATATADNEKVSVITALNLTDQLLKTRRMWREKVTRLIHLVETGRKPPDSGNAYHRDLYRSAVETDGDSPGSGRESSGSGSQNDSESLEITL